MARRRRGAHGCFFPPPGRRRCRPFARRPVRPTARLLVPTNELPVATERSDTDHRADRRADHRADHRADRRRRAAAATPRMRRATSRSRSSGKRTRRSGTSSPGRRRVVSRHLTPPYVIAARARRDAGASSHVISRHLCHRGASAPGRRRVVVVSHSRGPRTPPPCRVVCVLLLLVVCRALPLRVVSHSRRTPRRVASCVSRRVCAAAAGGGVSRPPPAPVGGAIVILPSRRRLRRRDVAAGRPASK